jgi:hypothetical protein
MMIKPGIEFTAPFRIYLPEDFFEVALGEKVSLVKPSAVPPVQTNGGIRVHGKDIEISHDIFGYAGRTKFAIILDEKIDTSSERWKKHFADSESLFIDIALMSANRLLEVYRDQDSNNLDEKSFHIMPLVKSDLCDFRIVAVDERLNEIEGFVIRKPAFHRVGFGAAVQRKPAIISAIRKLLKDGTPLPVYRELLNSAMNYIWRGQYRLVPVEANTALESFIPDIIHLLDPSVDRSELTNLYKKLLKLEDILSAAINRSNENAISWFTKPPDGWKTLVQCELKEWYDDCYCLRNKVIHEGFNNVSRQDAIKAYEASLSVINYVQTEARKIVNI